MGTLNEVGNFDNAKFPTGRSVKSESILKKKLAHIDWEIAHPDYWPYEVRDVTVFPEYFFERIMYDFFLIMLYYAHWSNDKNYQMDIKQKTLNLIAANDYLENKPEFDMKSLEKIIETLP